jgi:hypothetical protein
VVCLSLGSSLPEMLIRQAASDVEQLFGQMA